MNTEKVRKHLKMYYVFHKGKYSRGEINVQEEAAKIIDAYTTFIPKTFREYLQSKRKCGNITYI